MKKKNIILTLRVSPELHERLNLAVEKSKGRDQSDILRDALDLGLDDLALIGYNPMEANLARLARSWLFRPFNMRQPLLDYLDLCRVLVHIPAHTLCISSNFRQRF